MSSNVKSALLSRYFAKKRGVDINAGYNWEEIFNNILGPVDLNSGLGRMQAALRDVQLGFLNADYLDLDDETVAQLI